jgi:hypothetical protein
MISQQTAEVFAIMDEGTAFAAMMISKIYSMDVLRKIRGCSSNCGW